MDWNTLLCPIRIADLDVDPPPTPASEPWTEFDRDYGRAVFSSPVRRLQDKAQVFPMDPTDAVRTRLTHSLEVSSVARGLARSVALTETRNGHATQPQANAIEAIASTVALLHDIGNPPFGHAGEGAIRNWVEKNPDARKGMSDAEWADFKQFEGNAQTIRLVSRLQHLARDEGLNLTCGTMAALQKYVPSACLAGKDGRHSHKKPGFFQSESNLVQSVRERTGIPNDGRNPITLLMEAADDICFAVVDIEDGIKKGVVAWDQIANSVSQDALGKDLVDSSATYLKQKADHLVGSARDEAVAQIFRVHFIAKAVAACARAFTENRTEIMSGSFHRELVEVSTVAKVLKTCKDLAAQRVYSHPGILKMELMGCRVISDLMTMYWKGAVEADHDGPKRSDGNGMPRRAFALVSENYRRVFAKSISNGVSKSYARLQLITDQVCGMTDSYACRVHSEVLGG
ncbi:MAG: dNTP triphosphohydrolase [Planctomycetes bacterium]|nr:dNTP triphosphohydrolase [Planctomycetota bacterium]